MDRKLLRLLAILFAFALVAAACGDDDDATDAGTATAEEPTAEEPTAEEPTAEEPTAEEPTAEEPTAEEPTGDGGEGNGLVGREPVAADGEPIKIGFQNPEGDPAGSFPEYSAAAVAATEYINTELGGLGGRPIELEVCVMAITPDDSQRCANELSADGVELSVSSLNFFGNHFAIYEGSGIPVIVGTPITVGDFTAPGVYSVGGGGGCLGTHTVMVYTSTQIVPEELGIEINRVAVPWADTPPGVVCYYDLESKPLDVLNGSIPGESELAGSMPDMEHIGVPVLPGAADVTAQATEILDFDPDVIMYSAQGADCWTLVDALGRLGWTPEDTPLVLSGACIDFTAMEQAGDLANGIYFVGSAGRLTSELANIDPGKDLDDATIYQTKAVEYGLSTDDLFKGFATQGFAVMMNIWEMANDVTEAGGEISGQTIEDAFAQTEGRASFGSSPLSCSTAPAPYTAVCNAQNNVTQWDGTELVPVASLVSGIDLVAGTELLPGPY
jgi:branched-chain amino acid transport system substrate-binding protein